jgi:hypothetical protein
MERRLTRIEKQLGEQEPGVGEPILMVNVCHWPIADQERFRVGTPEERVNLIERHCGRRPPPTGPRGPIRTIIDMPVAPIDPARVVAEAEGIAREERER